MGSSSPILGVKIKNVWNHRSCRTHRVGAVTPFETTTQLNKHVWLLRSLLSPNLIITPFPRFFPMIFHEAFKLPKTHMGVSKNRDIPQNGWFTMENPMNKWMIWGYHYFWKHPHNIINPPGDVEHQPSQWEVMICQWHLAILHPPKV